MKKIIFLCVPALLIIYGCNLFSPSPKDVLMKYLDSYSKGNYSESYQLLSSKDKNFKNQKEYETEFIDNPFAKIFAGKISFNVKDVKVSGSNAEVMVEITAPDMSKAMGDLMGAAFASAFSDKKDTKAMEKMITEKLKDKSLPMTTTNDKYNLVKEEGGWRVFLNWEGQKKARDIAAEAANLEKSKKLVEAKAKYLEALSMDNHNTTVQQKLAQIDKKIEEYKIKETYCDKLEVRNVHTGSDFTNRIGVFGEVKNNGDRTLKEVEVTAYCLDINGKVVFEKTYHPVLVLENSFSMSYNTPLKPNYSRRFGFRLDDAPSDWNKKVKVIVTDVEFQ